MRRRRGDDLATFHDVLATLLDWLARSWVSIAFAIGFFVLWEALAKGFEVPRYIVPAPSAIFCQFSRDLPCIGGVHARDRRGRCRLRGRHPDRPAALVVTCSGLLRVDLALAIVMMLATLEFVLFAAGCGLRSS
jgi:hypothetical protein